MQINNWKLVYAHHKECAGQEFSTIAELNRAGFEQIQTTVPGNSEIDLMRAGKLDDLYFSANTLLAQELEDVHFWYYTTVQVTERKQYLCFEGIDTYADIYVNGNKVCSTDNMFLPYEVKTDWLVGENEILVHIRPTMLEMRKYVSPVACNAQKYSYPSLYARKAAHMFGWDIMPRIVSAGLWKEVQLLKEKEDKIQEVYLVTNAIYGSGENTEAALRFYIHADLSGPFATEYTVKVEGRCGNSHFVKEEKLWHNTHAFNFNVTHCKLWWPKNAGEANLYDTTVTLLRAGEVCDTYNLKVGIRTVALDRTDTTDKDGNGEFCFRINGKKIFVLGTNWVPLDALHSNDKNRLSQALTLLDDIGCNMVRCWGGNVYESEEFFAYCDAHGIMVWQDFAMGCSVYPDEEAFGKALEKEAVFQIKRLRNHASLTLWAGDNECDVAHEWSGFKRNPNRNGLTRNVLRRAVEMHDYARPYLPSSPYVSENVYAGKGIMPEEHLWGPRDYFKGPYYKDTFCHFASETGYHGFPATQSLQKFLREPEKIFNEDGTATDEYLVHAAGMEIAPDAPFAYRIRLAYNQVVTLFGKAEESLKDFCMQSQISQAEAKKYFIEKFRMGKWKRTGIIWWNLLDGWPQISDAVVDYYYCKKLAYHYIKRSQEPVCLMFDEPDNGHMRLVGVNDLPKDAVLSYKVTRMTEVTKQAEEMKLTEENKVLSGEAVLSADSATEVAVLPITEDEKEFYLITWELDGKSYKNHYVTNLIDIDYRKYLTALESCGMDEFEGF